MTKRASGKFKRNARDLYDTPASAVVPLVPHLDCIGGYVEPCAGNAALVKILTVDRQIPLYGQYDISYDGTDATTRFYSETESTDVVFITNPPWTREILHPIIENLRKQAPTWLLFDADWMHTKQAIPYLEHCSKIVSVGRVSWMQNGVSGFDNCCWYLFGDGRRIPVFHPRLA